MDPRYYIFLPVRNGEKYIAAALASIFCQTRTDWRLVVLENKSTDGTVEILDRMAHPSMVVVPSGKALSITDNWARIVQFISRHALGDKYCTVIGHDDLFLRDLSPYGIYGGVPAKLIRWRFDPHQVEFLVRSCWWDQSAAWLSMHHERLRNIDDFMARFELASE